MAGVFDGGSGNKGSRQGGADNGAANAANRAALLKKDAPHSSERTDNACKPSKANKQRKHAKDAFGDREFPMFDKDFNFLSDFAYKHTGIQLPEHKMELVYGRTVKRIRTLKIKTFQEYCQYLTSHTNEELGEFINIITTNLTSFFREKHHFDYLIETAIPELMSRDHMHHKLRIWSAGCSTGEEPYTIAMALKENVRFGGWDIKILATDLDSNVLAKGKSGEYIADRYNGLERKYQKYFTLIKGTQGKYDESYIASKDLKNLITFNRLNLMAPWPSFGPVHVLFCRNVVIYFDKPTQRKLFDRYADMMAMGGYFFAGHSENVSALCDRFELIGKTVYKKIR